jgi:O-antigen ligase
MTGKSAMSTRDLEAAAPPAALGPRARLISAADGLVTAIAVSLPWSTSATSILVVLWLVTLLPTLDVAMVRREVLSAAGGLPLLLWALGAIGMLWADVSWSERVAGLSGFHKLLLIPLLLAQFRRSGHAKWVFVGFLVSTVVLLVVSWAYILVPGLSPPRRPPGVPVKDYVFQSAIFATSAFGLLALIAEPGRAPARIGLALALAAFVADIFYVATGRTTLVVLAVLLLLFGLRQFGWKGALGAAVAGSMLVGAAWASSPYLRKRASQVVEEVQTFRSGDVVTPIGLRLEYWRRSSGFVAEAPLIGHGTGTIPKLFQRGTTADTDPQLPTDNPHNQLLAVMLQVGLLGAAALFAMWVAHLVLFRGRTLVAWFGLVVVVQNIVGSLFNSYLFDFSQGWLYVVGVGVAGGVVLHGTPRAAIEGKA